MPVDDLNTFELLTPEAEVIVPADSVSESAPITATSATTWEAAVARLWLTPQPRFIVALAGGTTGFRIYGGDGVTLQARAGAADVRNDVLRCAKDALSLPPPEGGAWVPANPEARPASDRCDCVILSGHAAFATGAASETPLYVLAPDALYCTYLDAGVACPGPSQRWSLRITGRAAADTPRDLRLADTTPGFPSPPSVLRVAGHVQVTASPTPRVQTHGPAAVPEWRVYRCTGDTRVAFGPQNVGGGWHRMAYGWAIQTVDPDSDRLLQLQGHGALRGPVRWLGCWRDHRLDRNLPLSVDIGTSTPTAVRDCAEGAAGAGRALFGVQAGFDCRAGVDPERAQKHGAADPETECDRGDTEGHATGGDGRVALYGLGDAWFPEPEVATVDLGWADYPLEYHGCFHEDPGDRALRALLPRPTRAGVPVTVQSCAAQAAALNKRVFSVQEGILGRTECYVDTDDDLTRAKRFKVAKAEDCNARDAAGGEAGGAGNARVASVYHLPAATLAALRSREDRRLRADTLDVWHHRCWVADGTTLPRQLGADLGELPRPTAVAECASRAAWAGQRVFGLKAGTQCWIAADRDAEPLASAQARGRSAGCGDGDDGEFLPTGGASSLSLYELPTATYDALRNGTPLAALPNPAYAALGATVPKGTWSHLGCFANPAGDARTLPVNLTDPGPTVNHVAQCAQRAAREGRRLFGVEAGGECRVRAHDDDPAAVTGTPARCTNAVDLSGLGTGGPNAANVYLMDEELRASLADEDQAVTACSPGIQLRNHQCWRTERNGVRALGQQLGGALVGPRRVCECAGRAARYGKRIFGVEAGGERCWASADPGSEETDAAMVTTLSRMAGVGRQACVGHPLDDDRLPTGGIQGGMSVYSMSEDTRKALDPLLPVGTVTVPSVWGPQSVDSFGCYKDDTNDRAMGRLSGQRTETNLLVQRCAERAAIGGRRWFATEAGTECWVREDDDGAGRGRLLGPSGGCAANGTGGSSAFNLYRLPDAAYDQLRGVQQGSTDGSELGTGIPGSVDLLGCFEDERMPFSLGAVTTVLQAAEAAAAEGRRLFGVGVNGVCRVRGDDNFEWVALARGATCDHQHDAKGMPMGGAASLSVYRMNDAMYNWLRGPRTYTTLHGPITLLYTQASSTRGTAVSHVNSLWDVGMRAWAAANAGGRFFALSDNVVTYGQSADEVAHPANRGRSTRADAQGRPMGGGGTNSVYQIPEATYASMRKLVGSVWNLPDGHKITHYGLYTDNALRAPFRRRLDTNMTVQQCAKAVAGVGGRVFGLEAGHECWLADSLTTATTLGRSNNPNVSKDANDFPSGGSYAFSLYELPQATYDAYHIIPVDVAVGSSSSRYKQVTVPAGTRECNNYTMADTGDRFWSQLDVDNRKLNVYRLDRDSGWATDLRVRCNRGTTPLHPGTKHRVFFGQHHGTLDGKNHEVNVPPNTQCDQPCGNNCYYQNATNSINGRPRYTDIFCNERKEGSDGQWNRMNIFRCDGAGNRLDQTFRFDVELPCTLSTW